MKTFGERRSIRKYQPRPVSGKLIEDIAAEASRAATMGNMQLYSLVVTSDPEVKARLAEAHHHQPMVVEAPAVLTFCADFNRFSKWCIFRDAVPGYGNFVSFFNAATDAMLFAQAFCTLAEENGLGTCVIGTTVDNPQMIIDILGLPRLVFPVLTVTLGYPDECPPQTDRLPLEALVHQEVYQDYTEQSINDFYRTKEDLPENIEFVKVNQKQTLAQVFAEIRYNKADNEAISEVLLETLKKQGFLR